MSTLQPIKVYGAGGPNPPKIGYVLEELGLPYTVIDISFPELKQPEYLAINPNGRMPAIQDPNTGLTLWESGAIVEYLVERYDAERKISFEAGSLEREVARQWLFFQVSGQGPYVSCLFNLVKLLSAAWELFSLTKGRSTASSCGSTSSTRRKFPRLSSATKRKSTA